MSGEKIATNPAFGMGNIGDTLGQFWGWLKTGLGYLFLFLLAVFVLWLIVSIIRWYRQQDKKAQAIGYRNYRHYKQKWRQHDKRKKLENRDLTPDQKRLLDAETAVWETHSTKPLSGVANEPYIQQADLQLQALDRQNLKRQFQFHPDPTINELHHDIELDYDGKIQRGLTSVFGRSTTVWMDRLTGKTVAEKELPFAELQFSLASGRQDLAAATPASIAAHPSKNKTLTSSTALPATVSSTARTTPI